MTTRHGANIEYWMMCFYCYMDMSLEFPYYNGLKEHFIEDEFDDDIHNKQDLRQQGCWELLKFHENK